MPKKLTKKQEAAKLAQALEQASVDAQRIFVQHEAERKTAETADKADHDTRQLDRIRERERLRDEREAFTHVAKDLAYIRRLALDEDAKHSQWSEVVTSSWLPSVHSESDITAFLDAWRDDQEYAMGMMNDETRVNMRVTQTAQRDRSVNIENMVLMRVDTAPTTDARRARLDEDLRMCTLAVQLTEAIWKDLDLCVVRGDEAKIDAHRQHLKSIYDHILQTLDRSTCVVVQYLDMFFDHDETLLKAVPQEPDVPPVVKYGLWVRKTGDKQRYNVNTIRYGDLGMAIDPKDSQTVRLPRGLQLQQRDNIAMRAMQLAFDPCTVHCTPKGGQEFHALRCVVVIESITFPERMKRVNEWNCRAEASNTHELQRNEYPPKDSHIDDGGSRIDEYTVKISFEVPDNVALRTRAPLLGKWNPGLQRWDPCGTANIVIDATVRRVSFLTSYLTTMALIQEKGFDVPYEQWQLMPVAEDEVLFVIEGRRRGESSDRELRIAIRELQCKLISPSDKELSHLRDQWMPPATLMRLLSGAGYNFLLDDKDAEFFDTSVVGEVLPKSKALEQKGYADIALFATERAFTSTRHNKRGEDPDMALFRMSRERRPFGSDEPLDVDVDDDSKWHSVRYELSRCALAQFQETDVDPPLANVPGTESHLNLYMTLVSVMGDDEVRSRATAANPLLQEGIIALLSLIRPFTWG